MRLLTLCGAGLFIGGFAAAIPAHAQEFDPIDCSALGYDGERQISAYAATGCLRALANYQSLLSISETVRRVVAGRLIGGPAMAEPAGLLLKNEAALAERLSASGNITVSPAADAAQAPAVQRKWNTWVDGKYSQIDAEDDFTNADGPLINITGGIDYKITDRIVFGLMGAYENSDLDTDGLLPVSLEAEGWGGGAYLGITLTSNIVFSGLVTYSGIDTDFDATIIDADIDSERVQASAGLTGYWYFGQTRLSPSVTIAWSKEWQDDFTDSGGGFNPDQTFETAVLTGGGVLAHTFAFDNGTSMEPFAGAFIDWTILNETKTDGAGTESFDDAADLRLQAGLNLTLAANIQLALTGELSGLLVDETDTYAGQANFAVQF